MRPHQISRLGLAYVPEERRIFSGLTVLENLEMGAYLSGPRRKLAESLEHVFSLFPILNEKQRQAAGTLSGGQQQRVAIARALATSPRFLLADEPTGNLDSQMAQSVMSLLEDINKAGTTILMVTHDPSLAARAKRQIYIKDGHVSELTNKNSNLHVVGEA